MIIRQPIILGLLLTLLALGSLTSFAVEPVYAHQGQTLAEGEAYPRPCLVMPHPLKQGFRPPFAPTAKQLEKDLSSFVPAEGVLGSAGRPIKELNVIAILCDFDDQPMEKDRAYFERVTEYLDQMYSVMSDGQLELNFTVTTDIYRLPEMEAFYGLDDSIATREALLVRDAVRAADPDVDFSQFNSYMLFHAGAGQEADINNDSKEQIWSVFFRQIDLAFWLPEEDSENGVRTNDFGDDLEPYYVTSMVVAPEVESQDGFEFGILGVVAHEFGHGFGLPDLYDTTAPDGFVFAESQGIGSFGLMGAGIWNAQGFFPAEMCAWSRYYIGWLRPEIIRPDGTDLGEQIVTLPAMSEDRRNGAVRIPLGGDEYFLIENRLRDYNGNGEFDFDDANDDGEFDFGDDSYVGCEFDWHLPREAVNEQIENRDGSGLLIWHIDESVIRERILFNVVNAEALQKGIDLEEADGIQDLDQLLFTFEAFGDPKDAWFAPHATEFTPESLPNSKGYGEAESSVWITEISAPGPEMTFKIRFGDFEDGFPLDLPGQAGSYQPITVDLDKNGTEEILVVTTVGDTQSLYAFNSDGSAHLPGNSPSSNTPTPILTGKFKAAPIVTELFGSDLPDLVFALEDGLYAMQGDGVYLTNSGTQTFSPEPFYFFERDPGEIISLAAVDVNGFENPEIIFGEKIEGKVVNVTTVTNLNGTGVFAFTKVTYDQDATLPPAFGQLSIGAFDFLESAHSVRLDNGGGYLAVGEITETALPTQLTNPYKFSIGDSVAFSAPVIGDLNRDGLEEIVVADEAGFVHALQFLPDVLPAEYPREDRNLSPVQEANFAGGNERFAELPGWPVFVGTLSDDELSLADIDGDGFLEVLVFGPNNLFYSINYNGVVDLELPRTIPGENRFTAPFLSPLALDIGGTPKPEVVLPMADGQVRAHNADGFLVQDFAYLGSGNQGTYPVLSDLDDDGLLEMVILEDIITAIPEDAVIDTGDEDSDLVRSARLLVREVGNGSGNGPWPIYRGDAGRSGRAPLPSDSPTSVPAGDKLTDELFVMPNPARGGRAQFHYVPSGKVEQVLITVHDVTGQLVRTLEGSTFSGVDNLVVWDLTNDEGSQVAPGLFVARIDITGTEETVTEFLTFAVLR